MTIINGNTAYFESRSDRSDAEPSTLPSTLLAFEPSCKRNDPCCYFLRTRTLRQMQLLPSTEDFRELSLHNVQGGKGCKVTLPESNQSLQVLLLDGKAQSAEADEHVYHELLVHPALLLHPNPKTVFVAGGGEGATVREVLKHKSVEKVVMVDIDEVVTSFCREHLEANKSAFSDPRLELIHDDARAQLEQHPGTFDVIIGDLADPVEGGPCYQLYTQEFYEAVIKAKLNLGGVFVTQSGPAGVLSSSLVFSPINHTLKQVFPQVIPYTQHIPSFADCWGWNVATKESGVLWPSTAADVDKLIAERICGELKFLDGGTLLALQGLNKPVRASLENEKHVLSLEKPRFIHGAGLGSEQ